MTRMDVDTLVAAVRDAFHECELPRRAFSNEADVRSVLLPAMAACVRAGIAIAGGATRVPDFVPEELIRPDGEARSGDITIALELKFLRGRGNADAGELHRGLGQCLAYASSDRYTAGMLLVVHGAPIRPGARGQRLRPTPGPILLSADPVRSVHMFNRWLAEH